MTPALTSAQKTTLAQAIAAHPVLGLLPQTQDNAFTVAATMNALASPNYWVWRTSVTRAEVYNTASDVPTTWNWTPYKAQSDGERDAWKELFMGGAANFGLQQVRSALDNFFTSAAAVLKTHAYAVARRRCTVAEKVFVSAVSPIVAGTGNDGIVGNRGNTSNPDLLGPEGNLTPTEVASAWGI